MGDIGKKNHSINLEESRTGYKHDFPEDLPPRNEPPLAQGRWRNRRFWIPSVSSFSIVHTPDGQARIRHIVMITILFLRAAMSGLSIFAAIIHNNVGAIVAYSLLALLSVWFTATCLGIIGDAAGDRDVKSVIIVSFENRYQPWHLTHPRSETMAFRRLPRFLPDHTRTTDSAFFLRIGWSGSRTDRRGHVVPDPRGSLDCWLATRVPSAFVPEKLGGLKSSLERIDVDLQNPVRAWLVVSRLFEVCTASQ